MYILLHKNIFLTQFIPVKLKFYFDELLWIPFTFLCVYIMVDLLKWNVILRKWLSKQFWRCCSCIYVLIRETADTEIIAIVTRASVFLVDKTAL